jgi:hypothetical protein
MRVRLRVISVVAMVVALMSATSLAVRAADNSKNYQGCTILAEQVVRGPEPSVTARGSVLCNDRHTLHLTVYL